jgi:integrase
VPSIHRLTIAKLNSLKRKGLHADGGNLLFRVSDTGTKSWVFRYSLSGRTRDMGLGPYPELGLAEVRERAFGLRKLLIDKIDPIEHRNAQRASGRVAAAQHMTFDDCADRYLDAHQNGWRSGKHARQWRETLRVYAGPVFGRLPVSAVDTALVMRALEPIWTTKPETATRVRGRIEAVLDWARVRGYRLGENPARWRGHLDHLLPARTKVRAVEHHAALPYADLGTFMSQLRQLSGMNARALEFLILTAARSGEVLHATWGEVDLANRVWVLPATRMKASRGHRVPLSGAALAVLEYAASVRCSDYIFPGRGDGKPLGVVALQSALRAAGRGDVTVHGLRSTFRDWAAETTVYPNHVVEMALAHAIGNGVEAAYRRGDLFDKRRQLMDDWATFCAGGMS